MKIIDAEQMAATTTYADLVIWMRDAHLEPPRCGRGPDDVAAGGRRG